ncbi:MCP four helix bundle domain-containing protein, partial [Blastococcus sp. SYSU DS0973]
MSTKTLTAVGTAAAVAVGVGVMGITALGTSADTSQALFERNIAGLEMAADMKEALLQIRIDSRNALLTPDDADSVQISEVTIPQLADDFHVAADAYADTFPTADKQALVDEAAAAFDKYVSATQTRLGPLALALDHQGWWAANETDVAPLAVQVDENLAQVREMEGADAEAAAAAAQDQYTSQRTLSIVVLLAGIALAAVIGLVVARGIAGGVRRVQRVAEALAAGDLTQSSGLQTRDELGRMGQALDTAVANMREVLSGVASSADAVAASSEELSASSSQISAGAEETSAQAGVVSAAAEEVSR